MPTLQSYIDAAGTTGTATPPAGIYRESITISNGITLDGSLGVQVRGSDDWSTGGTSGNTWSGTGPFTSSLTVTNFTRNDLTDDNYYDLVMGKNLSQVFIDGAAQVRVATTPAAGQFNLDASRHVQLGTNPSGHLVEVTMRNTWGECDGNNATVRNIAFRHVASSPNTTRGFGTFDNGTPRNQTYSGCTFQDAHGTGLEIGGATVTGCTFVNCGNVGLAVDGRNNTVTNNTFTNCGNGGYKWTSAQAQASSIKAAAVHNSSYAGNIITGSGGPGIWHDLGADGITIGPNNRILNTGGTGDPGAPAIMWEISGNNAAPSRIHDNVISNPAHLGGGDWRSCGILVSTASSVEIDHNLIQVENIRANGISIGAASRGDSPGSYVHDVSVHDNQIMVEGGDASGAWWTNPRGWGIGWVWDGVLTTPYSGANNTASANLFWYNTSSPAADSGVNRFQWSSAYSAIATFAATPGGTGSRYMTNAERATALASLIVVTPVVPAHLPSVGSSFGTWGNELNSYLLVAHNLDGTLRTGAALTPAPTALRATSGDQFVTLSWVNASGADTYLIETAPSGTGPWSFAAQPAVGPYVISGLTNGTTYWYRVRSYTGATPGGTTDPVSAIPTAASVAPVAPSLSSLVVGDKSLVMTVGAVANANSYQVFISITTTFGGTPETTVIANTTGQASGYSVTLATIGGVALTNGTTYYVTARAANSAGVSPNSTVQSAAPLAAAITFASVVSSVGYKHWWRLNETTGTSMADQAATGALNGTIAGTYTLNQATLLSDGDASNKSITFGAAAHINTAASADFIRDGNSPYSVWFTYKRTNADDGTYHTLLQTVGFSLYTDDNGLYWERNDIPHGFNDNYSTNPPAQNVIEHVLARYDGTWLTIYKNGTKVLPENAANSSEWSSANGGTSVWAIGGGADASFPWTGQIDEVVYFDKFVSDADAVRLYQAASGTTPTSTLPNSNLQEVLTNPPPEVPSGTLTTVRTAILATPSGSTYAMPDGIYRLASNAPIHIPAGVTVSNGSKRAWIFLSRDWATGGEAANTWTGPTSGYWTSSRSVPALNANEPGGVAYIDSAKALRYEMCVGITSTGAVTRFASIAAGGTPTAGQFCFTASGTRTIRLGTDPATFTRIEVVEDDPATGRWIWPDGNGVSLNGIVCRYASSGPQGDPFGSHDQSNFSVTNCVVGDTHGTAVNCGGSNNVTITDTLIEYAGNTGISTFNINGLVTSRNQIYNCGNAGYDNAWQGGATKFTVTTNHTCEDNILANNSGDGLWWDVSAFGPISIQGNLVHNTTAPCLHMEVSSGPWYVGTTKGNCFAYNLAGGGSPVAYVSSCNGPGEITNNLIISSVGRGLQVEWNTSRTDAQPVQNWLWHNNRYIVEGDVSNDTSAIWVNDVASNPSNNNRGDHEQYYFGSNTTRWSANGGQYTDLASWNATAFDEAGVLVSGATAAAWRAAWGI